MTVNTADGDPSSVWDGFLDAAQVQARVVGALILREMLTRYGRSGLGYLWAVIEPTMMLGVFWAVFSMLGFRSYTGMELVPFLACGIVTFFAISGTVGRLRSAIEANRGLLIYPQVTPLDTMIARAILETATFVVVFVTIISGAWLLGMSPLPADGLGVVIALVAAMALAFSWGMVEWGVAVLWPTFDRISGPIWRVMLFTSGAFYSLKDVPDKARLYLELNPIAHAIEFLRSAFFADYVTPITSYVYLVSWITVSLFTGLLLERALRDRVKEA